MAISSRTRSRLISLSLFLILPLLVSCADNSKSPRLIGGRAPFASGRILIKFRPGASDVSLSATAQEFGLQPTGIKCGSVYIYKVRPGTELNAVKSFTKDPNVEYAEPDYLIFAAQLDTKSAPIAPRGGTGRSSTQSATASDAPNDTLFAQQWALAKLEAESAWKISNGNNITIAVIDSGVDLDHPEFAGRIVEGYDFVNDDNEPEDDYGHGTQVAGVAAAAAHNAIGIAGLAWDARIMPVKVLDNRGRGVSSDLTCALYWATERGAQILNISIISFGPSFGMQSAINHAVNAGVLIFAASGNLYEDGNPITYPAAHKGVVAVAATDKNDNPAWFSSAGGFVDIAAPGVRIFSLFPPAHGEYRAVSGTSMASPYGAGLAALVLSAAPGLSIEQVEAILKESALDLGDLGRDDRFGHGRIDAAAAMSLTLASLPFNLFLPAGHAPAPTSTPSATPTPSATATPTLTPTLIPTSTPTLIPTSTPTATAMPEPTEEDSRYSR